jgi:hypothetical protein
VKLKYTKLVSVPVSARVDRLSLTMGFVINPFTFISGERESVTRSTTIEEISPSAVSIVINTITMALAVNPITLTNVRNKRRACVASNLKLLSVRVGQCALSVHLTPLDLTRIDHRHFRLIACDRAYQSETNFARRTSMNANKAANCAAFRRSPLHVTNGRMSKI